MNKKDKLKIVWFTVLPALIVGALLYESLREDKMLTKGMEEISASSRYAKSATRIYVGELGGFYSCLRNYRALVDREVTNPENRSYRFKLFVEPDLILHLGMSGSEAYSFEISKTDGGGGVIETSKSYAINCELGLLDS